MLSTFTRSLPQLVSRTSIRSFSRSHIIMSSPYTVVATDKAPAAIGPYVQAVKYNGLIYASGSIPLDPVSMEVVQGGIEEQTAQVFKNVSAVLSASNATPASVLKTTVFLKSMNDFVAFNKIYADFFGETKPARSCVEVARLPKDVLVEIEFVAVEGK
ncbi:Endoribonuclease L-PSP/chorismate mutase-like protein [Naematelia encephala]|uniref:Endoribonuclease L-PSP/chorismate mutase-like protein n=1 Tax=Naematelia encephala TaxID=71784 RepID=A0A1Y2AJ06_9TREE|nr:Endoribonuclease L-PSP/chorismate mutase-like protein [Naematelia encephala]